MGNKKQLVKMYLVYFIALLKNALVHSSHTQYHDCVTALQMIILCTVVYSVYA